MSEKREMSAVEYFRAKKRMTKMCAIKCADCPIAMDNNGTSEICKSFEQNHPEKAVASVQKWAEEHPVKTRMADFLEKFPNAKTRADGTPFSCPVTLGYTKEPCCNSCKDCWNRPLEVEE